MKIFAIILVTLGVARGGLLPYGMSKPSNVYLPPVQENQETSNYESPRGRYLPPPAAQRAYLPPVSSPPRNAYLPPVAASANSVQSWNPAPKSAYLPPSRRYLPASNSDDSWSRQSAGKSLPRSSWISGPSSSSASIGSTKWRANSLSINAPASWSGATSNGANQYHGQSAAYSGSHGYHEYEPTAPAKYEFEYKVDDHESGNDYMHKESRDGDATWGVYSVVLPDGRKQIVEYEADHEGYKPKITYEEPQHGYANKYAHHQGPY